MEGGRGEVVVKVVRSDILLSFAFFSLALSSVRLKNRARRGEEREEVYKK